jgi:6-phosphogluconate dehydrogenase
MNQLINHEVPAQIGVIGMGVMGKNLALNLVDHDYTVAVLDSDKQKMAHAAKQASDESGKQDSLLPCESLAHFLKQLSQPRIILLSVPAGNIVDTLCDQLLEAGLNQDDVVIDTGNSLWTDSVKRDQHYKDKFYFFSTAVSGGEVGARFGPSLMPSGNKAAWSRIEPILQNIAAKVDPKTGKAIERFEVGNPVTEGEPCVTYIGPNGSGHFVKMVHNGIEYADMQLICEAYDLMKTGMGMQNSEIGDVFAKWNNGPLESYLIEITADILKQRDIETDKPLVDLILDKAGQKGTGVWTAISSLETGCPTPTIAQAVYARSLSTLKTERVAASHILNGPSANLLNSADKEVVIAQLEDALFCAKICVYAQGFQLMAKASAEHNWSLNFAEIAKIWRAGCIIRASFLQHITNAYLNDKALTNLLIDPFFTEQVHKAQNNWRQTLSSALLSGIPFGAFQSTLSYYDSYRSSTLPANLLQAQRDYFGAHTFERVDQPSGQKFHVEWTTDTKIIIPVE